MGKITRRQTSIDPKENVVPKDRKGDTVEPALEGKPRVAAGGTVAVVAFDQISPFHLAVSSLVFGEPSPVSSAFEQIVCSTEKGLLHTTGGFGVVIDHGLEALDTAQIIVIPDWGTPFKRPEQSLLDALVAAHERGVTLIGLRLGSFVLAEAGLLEGCRATTHWAYARDFARRYPGVLLAADALYVADDNIVTSAGAVAGIDCCLDMLRQQFGAETANRVAQYLVMSPHRQGSQAQFVGQPLPATVQDQRLGDLLNWMRAHLEMPHSLSSLAKTARMSSRTFTRHFRQLTGTTVGDWLLNERLTLCQRLLETTGQSIESIAELSGFGSPVTLRHHFGKAFGASPTEWRQTRQGGGKLRQLQADRRFFECMDRVNRAIQGTTDLEQMLNDVLDVVLAILDCDRAFLMHPCDPQAETWHVSMLRTRPEYPPPSEWMEDIRMDSQVREVLRILLDTNGPVKFGPGADHALPEYAAKLVGMKSNISIAIHPKLDRPWIFGVEQCGRIRVWTSDEERIFQEIGRRLADGLTSMLTFRDLREREKALSISERGYRTLVENIPDLIVRFDRNLRRIFVNQAWLKGAGITAAEVIDIPAIQNKRAPLAPLLKERLMAALESGTIQTAKFNWTNARGESLLLEYVIVPEYNQEGQIVNLLGIGHDIAERERMEIMLRVRDHGTISRD